jgi:hypothetical protein
MPLNVFLQTEKRQVWAAPRWYAIRFSNSRRISSDTSSIVSVTMAPHGDPSLELDKAAERVNVSVEPSSLFLITVENDGLAES